MFKSNPKRKKILVRFLFILNLVAIFFLFITYLSVYISPENFKFISIFGLVYSFSLIFNFIIIIIWLFVNYKMIIISIFSILIGWNHLSNTFQIHFNSSSDSFQNFEVLSFNVRMFDKYNWISEDGTTNNILNFIEKQDADIVCIQEFYSNKKGNFDMDNKISKFSKSKFSHISYAKIGTKLYGYGIATYTRFKIVNKGTILFDNSENFSIFTDVIIAEDTVRIYNCHLESVHFEYEDYRFLDSLSAEKTKPNQYNGFKKIMSKVLKASQLRAKQAQILTEHIKTSIYPIIICGDFNDTPVSYVYQKLSKNLNDAFVENGYGFGSTYLYSFFSLRIDYILYSPFFESFNFKTHHIKVSDHFPITCKFKIKEKTNF